MHGQYRKADLARIKALKGQGLSNAQIARRLGVCLQAVHYALRKTGRDKAAPRGETK